MSSSIPGHKTKHPRSVEEQDASVNASQVADLARVFVAPKACASPVLSSQKYPIGSSLDSSEIAPSGSSKTEAWAAGAAGAVNVFSAGCDDTPTSIPPLAPNNFTIHPTNATVGESHPSISVVKHNNKPEPIFIPPPTLTERDINRVPTPLSGRGDRKGHLFPFSRSPSPSPRLREVASQSPKGKARTFSCSSDEGFFPQLEGVQLTSPATHSSASGRPPYSRWKMHNDSITVGRYPASPLSPKPSTQPTLSPQSAQRRGNHGRQASRNMHLNLGRYHPSNFPQDDGSLAAAGSAAMQGPVITYTRAPPAGQIESPRLMREKHREFIAKARLTSKLAASPMAAKPDAPRLDPLGSPKGPVTPLVLEEGGDYFSTTGAGKVSPAASPGARSPRRSSESIDDDTKPVNKGRKLMPSS